MSISQLTKFFIAISFGVLVVSPVRLLAVVRTWDGGGGTANFGTAANWSPDGVPANGDDLTFPSGTPATVNNDLTARTFGKLTFSARTQITGNAFSLSGGLQSGGLALGIGIDPTVTLTADQTFTVSNRGGLDFNGGVTLAGNALTVEGTTTLTFNGLTGSNTAGSQIAKQGPGLLRFSNSGIGFFPLPLTVAEGTLDVDGTLLADVTLRAGKLTGEGSISGLTAGGFVTEAAIEPDAGDLQVTGDANFTSGAHCYFHLTGAGLENTLSCTGSVVSIPSTILFSVDAVGYTPVRGEVFQLISKSTSGPISGTAPSSLEGTEIEVVTGVFGGFSYFGGNGNDVTLTCYEKRTWDGGATLNDNWTDEDNWTLNRAPVAGDVLIFPAGIQSTDRGMDNNFAADTTFRQLVFEGDDFTVGGARLRLTHGVSLASGINIKINTGIVLARDQTFRFSTGTSGELELGSLDEIDTAGFTLSLAGKGVLHAEIIGAGGVKALAGSSVSLSDASLGGNPHNSFTGSTVIEPNGSLQVREDDALGAATAGTTVRGELVAGVSAASANHSYAEPLTFEDDSALQSDGFGIDSPALGSSNTFTGSMSFVGLGEKILAAAQESFGEETLGEHFLNGPISGTGVLHLIGDWQIGGSASNTFAGDWRVEKGAIRLQKNSAGTNALSGTSVILIGSDSDITCTQNEQIADNMQVHIGGRNLFLGDGTATTETIRSLTMLGASRVEGGPNAILAVKEDIFFIAPSSPGIINTRLRLQGKPSPLNVSDGAPDTDLQINGDIISPNTGESLAKRDPGRLVTFGVISLPCDIEEGIMECNGASGTAASMRLKGGTLSGNGSVGSVVAQTTGGIIAPGAVATSPVGTLSTRTLSLNSATSLSMDIGITSLPNGHDKINVIGGVNLQNASLELHSLPSSGIALGAEVVLVSNDGSDGVSGQFAGLAQDILIPFGNIVVQISYHGGDGNDVTIRRVSLPNIEPKITSVTITPLPGQPLQDSVLLEATVVPTVTYRVQTSVDLLTWETLSSVTADGFGHVSVGVNALHNTDKRFFQLAP